MNWSLEFQYPLNDDWPETERKLEQLITEHGGTYDGGGTDFRLRDTYGLFETYEAAKECGNAAHALYIQFLSWRIEPINSL